MTFQARALGSIATCVYFASITYPRKQVMEAKYTHVAIDPSARVSRPGITFIEFHDFPGFSMTLLLEKTGKI